MFAEQRAETIETPVSAGGVVFRRGRDELVEIALCGRIGPTLWSLPKGTPIIGESIEQTALREVQEETGLEVRIVQSLGYIEYWFTRGGVRNHKRVYHFLMVPMGGELDLHDTEFDVVEWFPEPEAIRVLSYANEVEVVHRAMRVVREGLDGPAGGG